MLKPCATCRHQIASNAEKCPSCGVPNVTGFRAVIASFQLFFGLCALVVGCYMLYMVFKIIRELFF